MSNENPFKTGDRVRVVVHPTAGYPHWAEAGDEYNVLAVAGDQVDLDGTSPDTVHHEWLELIERLPVKPERPRIDFSGDSRKTAREYAGYANSRVLKDASQATLKAVSLGWQVDAYDLNEAILDAMRSMATRAGRSTDRREMAKFVAYLGHIVQAVLTNHADGLPVYEAGARSQRIAALEQENGDLRRRLDEANRFGEESDRTARDLSKRVEELEAQLPDAVAQANWFSKRHDSLVEALNYAKSMLSSEHRNRVEGFHEGHLSGIQSGG